MTTTTLNAIRVHRPCEEGWKKLLGHLGKTKADDEALPLLTILDSNGLDDALWCFCALGPEWKAWARLTTCDIVQPAMAYAAGPAPQRTLNVARAFARGEATEAELRDARDAAWAEQERILRAALAG